MRTCCGLLTTKDYDPVSIPLRSVEVHCDIHNIMVNLTSKLTYVNQEDKNVEAVFIFPLEEGSAIYHFEAQIGDRRIVAECQEKQEARDNYERAVDEGHTAFLLEEDDSMGDTFKCSLGNLLPKSEVIISIKYITQLTIQPADSKKGETVSPLRLTLPTVLNPRYTPAKNKTGFTDQIEYYQATAESFYTFGFSANLKGSQPLRAVTSVKDTFSVDFTNDNHTHAKIGLKSKFNFDHDLLLDFVFDDGHKPHVIYEKAPAHDAFNMDVVMLSFMPTIDPNIVSTSKNEFVFLIDRSGSMSGDNMDNAKQSLLLFLKSLPEDCKFQIYGFGSHFEPLFPTTVAYSEETLETALDYQSKLEASFGGTEVLAPLKAIYETPPEEGYMRNIFFLTDGDVSNTSEVVSLVSSHCTTTRIFAVGIGHGASTALVSGVALAARGRAEFVREVDELRGKVMSLLESSLHPRMTDVKMTWNMPDGIRVSTTPPTIPPIFAGQYITVFGLLTGDVSKLDRDGATATLSANLEGVMMRMEVPVRRSEGIDGGADCGVRRLAAKYQIREMCAMAEDKVNKSGIVAISTQANIVSRYTSMIGIDPEKKADSKPEMRSIPQPRRFASSRMMMQCAPQPMMCAMRMMKCAPPQKSKSKSKGASVSGLFKNLRRKSDGSSRSAVAMPPPMMMMRGGGPPPGACYDSIDGMEDMECDDLGDGDDFSRMQKEEENVPPVIKLAQLQTFKGFWKWDSVLINKVLKTDEAKVKSGKPANVDDNCWATALVVAFLEKNCQSTKAEWSMMAQKARNWLTKNAKDAETIIKAALAHF